MWLSHECLEKIFPLPIKSVDNLVKILTFFEIPRYAGLLFPISQIKIMTKWKLIIKKCFENLHEPYKGPK